MKIFVCMKQTFDTETRIALTEDGRIDDGDGFHRRLGQILQRDHVAALDIRSAARDVRPLRPGWRRR